MPVAALTPAEIKPLREAVRLCPNYWDKVSEEKLHQICDQIDAIVEPLIKRTDENWAPTTREAVLDQFVRSVSIVI